MPATPEPELIADRYVLGELVGSGGMGEVHAGHDTKLDRPVAIKFLRPDMASQADLRSRFEAEARAAGRLSHPNVVGVFDTGEHEGRPFIVMELLSGRTLADEAAQGPADETRARQVGREILSALGASHAQGILHRDLKPGNVLLTREGSVKVGDFGVAKMAEGMDLTQAGMVLGTPSYLAPERIAGESASECTDIYSVGVMLYELVAGRRPFQADTPLGLIRAIQDDPVPPLDAQRPGIDPRFSAVVARAMARDPAERYSSAAEMEADLATEPPPAVPLEETSVGAAPNPTRVLETPEDVHPTEPTVVSRPAPPRPKRAAAWDRLPARLKWRIVGTCLALVLVLILVRGIASPDREQTAPAPTPAAETSDGDLPAPLEGALRELEEAVQP
ncbi:MAG TPA: protein kinase [Actinomycetota bacterium]|nr:protein kinase [Actinomycetota bacterium]